MSGIFPFFTKPLPPTFDYMPRQEQIKFVKTVTDYIQKNYPSYTLDFKNGLVIGDDDYRYGLDNLAKQFHHAKSEEQSDTVAKHFEKMIKLRQEEKELLNQVDNYKAIKSRIMVRILPADYLPTGVESNLITRTDLEDTITTLVFDLPSGTSSVKKTHAEKWGKTIEELYQLGIENTLRTFPAQITKEDTKGGTIWVMKDDDNLYATTGLLDFTKFPQMIGKYGSLVIIPRRHVALSYPIEDWAVQNMFHPLIVLTKVSYKEGTGSLSENLYWYHNSKFTKVPYEEENGKFSILLVKGDELREMMLSLPKN